MLGRFANIIIDIAHESVDKVFQYKIPENLRGVIRVGQEVVVPFGRGNKTRKGYVVEITDKAEFDESRIKELTSVAEQRIALEGQLIELAGWMKETYGSTMIQALKTVLPVKDKIKELEKKNVTLLVSKEDGRTALAEYQRKKYGAKARLIEKLLENPMLDLQMVKQQLNISAATLKSLEKDGMISINRVRIYRNPVEREMKQEKLQLTNLQKQVIEQIHHVFHLENKKPFLLHGITGSGKTEVYVELVARAAAEKQASIVLIPEIALTKQTVMRFYKRFGDRVSVLHSRLSKGERYDQFQRAARGEIDVMIGPRSALFTPFSNLGYIIIDEEHESSYKSESVPKYHARETAIKRAEMTGAAVVLASATPSVDSYYKAEKGMYQLVEMKERISGHEKVKSTIIDLREEMRLGNRSIFSLYLQESMKDRLEKGQQILLFLNRRGYHGFVSCRACGAAVKCPNCDVTLSLHNNGKMLCHYCGYEQLASKQCPSCGSKYIGGFRIGTEQVEEQVKKMFPQAGVLRMDTDTTRKKHGHDEIVTAFRNQNADILIGTQMIVKGHDFPNVTLVGILAADMSLHVSDFRSAEKTFQLLTQAAGRAGRGALEGEVIIQSYNPGHYTIRYAKEQDYEGFYREEMLFRNLMKYPPAGFIMEVFMSSADESAVGNEINKVAQLLEQFIGTGVKKQEIIVVGPAPAAIAKLNNLYRKVIYVRCQRENVLVECRKFLEAYYDVPEHVQLQFDRSM